MTEVLKNTQKLAEKFDNDPLKIATELRRIQSVKCRLNKQKGKSSYQQEITETLQYEQALKEARALVTPKDKTVTTYTQDDVNQLDYDETVKAIKSIQTKKCLSRWLTENEGDNDEYRNACKIEEMLLEHKKTVQPVEESLIRKTDLQTIIDLIESTNDITKEKVLELLNKLM